MANFTFYSQKWKQDKITLLLIFLLVQTNVKKKITKFYQNRTKNKKVMLKKEAKNGEECNKKCDTFTFVLFLKHCISGLYIFYNLNVYFCCCINILASLERYLLWNYWYCYENFWHYIDHGVQIFSQFFSCQNP